MGNPVTDPALLEMLEGKAVSDPALLAQLEGTPKPYSRLEETSPDAVKERAGQVGRVFLKTLASPAVLASKAAHKVADFAGYGDKVADLGPLLNEQLDKLAPAPTGMAGQLVEGMAESAPALLLPGGWIPQVAGNAALGAVQAEKGHEGTGAAVGGGLGAAGKVLTRAITGLVTPSASARELMERGIQPTVGQGAASSAIHAAEDLTAGIPIVGQVVRSGQKRAIGEFQQELFKGAMGTTDEALNKFAKMSPRDQIVWINDVLTPRYDHILDGMPPVHVPPELRAGLSRAMDRMPVDVRSEYNRIMTNYLSDAAPLTGRRLKDLNTELGELTGDLLDSGSAMEKRAARVIGEQRGKLKELMPPELQGVDDLYSKFLRMREASYRTLKPEEGITPAAYQQAVKQTSLGNQFARGEATGQELSDAAQILKPSPNGGMSMLAAGGAAGLSHLAGLNIPAIVAAVTAALGSTRPGAAVAFGNTGFQKSMANLMRETNPITGAPLPFSAPLIRARAMRTAPAVVGAAIADKNRRKPLNEY